jgi:hypothetical protein
VRACLPFPFPSTLFPVCVLVFFFSHSPFFWVTLPDAKEEEGHAAACAPSFFFLFLGSLARPSAPRLSFKKEAVWGGG